MNELVYLILAFISGLALGIFFFGGLWITVNKAMTAKIPAIWFFVSFTARVSISLIGFYYISLEGWQSIVVAIIGFIASRFVITNLTRTPIRIDTKKEVYHEA